MGAIRLSEDSSKRDGRASVEQMSLPSAAGAQRGQAGPRSGLPAAVSACGRVRGPGVSPAGSCKGWCVLAERGPVPVGVLVGE